MSTEYYNRCFYDNFIIFVKEFKIILKYRKENEEQFLIVGKEQLKIQYQTNYKNDDIELDFLNPHPDNYEPNEMECFNYSLKSDLNIFEKRHSLLIPNCIYPKHDYDLINMVYNETYICDTKQWRYKWAEIVRVVNKKHTFKTLDLMKLETDIEYLLLDILNCGYEDFSCHDGTKYNKKDIEKIGSSKFVTLNLIEKYWGIPWDYEQIIDNPNLTEEFVLKHIQKFKYDINTDAEKRIISIPCLSIKFIKDHEEHFDLFYISQRTCLTINDIENNQELYWDWNKLSVNPSFNIKELKQLSSMFVVLRHYILSNPNITETEFDNIIKSNNDLFMDDIKNNLCTVCSNVNINLEWILKHRDIWSHINEKDFWEILCSTPKIYLCKWYEFINHINSLKNCTEFKFKILFNTNTSSLKNYINIIIVKWLACRRIQRHWRQCRWNPIYKLCRDIQIGRFESIMESN